jgi:hypothetical protein
MKRCGHATECRGHLRFVVDQVAELAWVHRIGAGTYLGVRLLFGRPTRVLLARVNGICRLIDYIYRAASSVAHRNPVWYTMSVGAIGAR